MRIIHFTPPLLLLLLLTFTACSETNESCADWYAPSIKANYLKLEMEDLHTNCYSYNQSTTLTSINTPWALEWNADWLELSPRQGTESADINITLAENIHPFQRAAVVLLKSTDETWAYERNINITQDACKAYITPSTNSISFTGSGGSQTIDVKANCAWRLLYSYNTDNWVTAQSSDNKLQITAAPNNTGAARSGYLYVRNDSANLQQAIYITQQAANISASTQELVFNNTASTQNITLKAEAEWTASTSDAWIELSATSGKAGESTLSISVAPNNDEAERSGYVYLMIGGKRLVEVPIRQRGIYVETSANEFAFDAPSSSQTFSVQSNTQWNIVCDAPWVSFNHTSGSGNADIQLTVTENKSTALRSAFAYVERTGTSTRETLVIVQSGYILNIGTTELQFTDKASTQQVEFDTNGEWTATSADSWIHVSPTQGKGNAEAPHTTISVGVDENNTDDERIGSITLQMADATHTIAVVQQGKYFNINNDQLNFESKGGNLSLNISTNGQWTASIDASAQSWLSLAQTSGTGNITDLRITAADNASPSTRTGIITFNTQTGKSYKLTLKQAGRYLRASATEVSFYAKGGSSQPINITTDGVFSATTSASWLTIQRTGNAITLVATANNTPNVRTATVDICLTDLREGELKLTVSVTQLNKGGSFTKTGFDDDQQYDNSTSGKDSQLTIGQFDDDKQYD